MLGGGLLSVLQPWDSYGKKSRAGGAMKVVLTLGVGGGLDRERRAQVARLQRGLGTQGRR